MPGIQRAADWVADIESVCGFHRRHFAAEAGPRYENRAEGLASRFLCFDGGARPGVMSCTGLEPGLQGTGSQRLGCARLAISLGTEQAVDALAALLQRDGVPVIDGPRRTGDAYHECVSLDPEGKRVEVTAWPKPSPERTARAWRHGPASRARDPQTLTILKLRAGVVA